MEEPGTGAEARSPALEVELARLRRGVRLWLGLFIVGLVLSGLTAFPLLWELRKVTALLGLPPDASPGSYHGLSEWLLRVREGLEVTHARFPFIAYGTDWLAFGHVVIALFFIAPWREPGRHLSVIRTGMLACVLVVPLALICGAVRDVPLPWRLLDCSFGVVAGIPLWIALRKANDLRRIEGGAHLQADNVSHEW